MTAGEDGATRRAMRVQLGVMFAAIVLWQAQGALVAWAAMPAIGTLLLELGAELPSFTRFALVTHRAWGLAPVITSVVAIDVLRRPRPTTAHALAVLVGGALVALSFQTGLLYAVLEPILQGLGKVDNVK